MTRDEFETLQTEVEIERAREVKVEMARYRIKEDLHNAALGVYREYGFRLEEPADHLTDLYFKDKKIATFNQHTLTIPKLHEECFNFMKSL